MATLEKIRNRSVLLFVIIIVALLAFILGDFLTSGRSYFGSPTTVAKAKGTTVEYQDYQNRMSQVGEQLRNQGRDYSNDVLSQTVIQDLVQAKLMQKEYQKLGLKVTDNELTDLMTGPNQSPAAAQLVAYLSQQIGLPEPSAPAIFEAMQNPAKYGLPAEAGKQLRTLWSSQEKELEQQMLNQKFLGLVSGLYTYNNLDAKAFYDDNAATRTVAYVVKDVVSVGDDEVEFDESDIRKLWNEQKGMYILPEEAREIDYIYVPIEPSQADRLAGQQIVEEAVQGLNNTPGTEAVANNTGFVISNAKTTLSQVRDNRLRDVLKDNAAGYAQLLSHEGDTYTVVKILDTKQGIDSINVSVLQVADANVDSVLALANSGKSFASISNGANIQGQDSLWTTLEVDGIQPALKASLTNATVGKAFAVNDTIQGTPLTSIYKVNKRHAPVSYYDVAMIEYTVDPSTETLTDLTGRLRTFTANHSSADDFTKSAAEEGYPVMTDIVSASSTGIGTAAESRKFVKWALEAKKGQVSPMMEDDKQTYLIAVAVKDIYKDYLPYNAASVRNQLRAQALNSKKADKLMADYKGKGTTVADYATAMGAEVQHGEVSIISPVLLNLGLTESAIQGAIAASDKGAVVGPVKGNHGIIVFEVEEVTNSGRPFSAAEYGPRFVQNFGLNRLQSTLPLLLGKDKVENRTLNFVQSPVE